MSRKLTLRLDGDAIERAKRYAARRGTSVSKLVERFFDQLEGDAKDATGQAGAGSNEGRGESIEDSELVASLRGLLAEADTDELDEEEYYDHLWEKHR